MTKNIRKEKLHHYKLHKYINLVIIYKISKYIYFTKYLLYLYYIKFDIKKLYSYKIFI